MRRQRIKGFFIGLMAAASTVALAATFDYFSPATGILVGTSSTYVTTAATSANVRALWSGTCNSSTFLRGDGACAGETGTVSSVALTMPSGFSIAGSPITSSGTLAVTTTLNGVIHGNGSAFSASNVVLTSEVSGILPGANGGTGNEFFAVSGPTTSLKTFAFPDASATVLTTNAAVTVPQGGTGLTSGTSGGVPYFNSTTTLASSALLAANQLVLGGGAGTAPATLGSLGTTTTVLHGNAAGAPTFGAVSLTADVTGTLPVANGGTNLTAATDDDTMIGNGTTWQSKAIPDCDDTSGQHLNYDTTTNAFSCGTTATTRFSRGYFECEDTTCATITSAGVSSITRNGIGNYTVNLNAGFTTAPVCVATSTVFSDFTTNAWMGTTTTTAATVLIGVEGTAMTTADGDFHIICQGT